MTPTAAPRSVAAGTPHWAVVATRVAAWSVVPSAVWRTAVGLGVPLGWTQEHLDLERIPGYGTVYVLVLSVMSITASFATYALVKPWGERWFDALPLIGGRRIPTVLVAGVALAGAAAVAVIVVVSVVHWSSVSGFADRPVSFWSVLMVLCYLPALLWSPAVVAATVAYVRRRNQRGRPGPQGGGRNIG